MKKESKLKAVIEWFVTAILLIIILPAYVAKLAKKAVVKKWREKRKHG